MENKNNKFYVFLWTVLFFVTLYIGWLLGGVAERGMELIEIQASINHVLENPFANYYNEYTKKMISLTLFCYVIALLMFIAKQGKYMHGREFGSGKWGSTRRLNKKFMDKNEQNNKILSANLKISIDGKKTRLNNNVLTIGGAGSGKTLFGVTPNIHMGHSSIVVTDPKGEILRENGRILKEMGYEIKVINLYDMDGSDGYNPFMYVKDETDVIKLITNLIANTTPKGSTPNDPFWEKAEGLYLQSLFLYVWMEYPLEQRNFNSLLELLNKAEVTEDEESELDIIMNRLAMEKGEQHPAVKQYRKCVRGAGDTVRSIIISANSRMAFFENPKLKRILEKDEIDISTLGMGVDYDRTTKTALFCVIPDNDKSYNFVVGMLYTQIFQQLYYQADFVCGGMLPIQVHFWLDEFANVALPDDFCSLLSTMRSRGISANMIIQNMAQIKALFKDTWETIPGNSDVLIYLGGNEQGTHEYISKLLDKATIDKRSYGETRGRNGSASRNEDRLGRELLTVGEVRSLDNNKCLVFIRGEDPVIDRKYPTFYDKKFKYAKTLGAYMHNQKQEKSSLKLISEESVKGYKELEKKGEGINVHTFLLEDFLSIEFVDEPEESIEDDNVNWEEISEYFKEMKDNNQEIKKEIVKKFVKEGTLYEIIQNNDFTIEQYKEIELGFSAGLEEEEIKKYLNPAYEPEQMALVRMLILYDKIR